MHARCLSAHRPDRCFVLSEGPEGWACRVDMLAHPLLRAHILHVTLMCSTSTRVQLYIRPTLHAVTIYTYLYLACKRAVALRALIPDPLVYLQRRGACMHAAREECTGTCSQPRAGGLHAVSPPCPNVPPTQDHVSTSAQSLQQSSSHPPPSPLHLLGVSVRAPSSNVSHRLV